MSEELLLSKNFDTCDATRLSRRSTPKITLLLIAGFLLLFFLQGWFFIRANSQTVDEAAHLAADYSLPRHWRLSPRLRTPTAAQSISSAAAFAFFSFVFQPRPATLAGEGRFRHWLRMAV